jgi:hypothetical protein
VALSLIPLLCNSESVILGFGPVLEKSTVYFGLGYLGNLETEFSVLRNEFFH